ncbi:MAG: hypothetical protein NG747_08110 [Candidatus Brocadia sp.]|nr:hypothetical protein [Candidatus Brocadia sp.]
MSVPIVGDDNLGSIPKELDKIWVTEIRHAMGRSGQKIHDGIPKTMYFYFSPAQFFSKGLKHSYEALQEITYSHPVCTRLISGM